MTTTTRTQTPTEARKAALESGITPLYAVAGLTDAVASTLKSSLTATQEKANQRFAELQGKREEQARQAKATVAELNTFVRSLPEQVKTLPEVTKARISELQKQASELVAEVNTTYAELAGRGKRIVDDSIGTAKTVTGKAGKKAEDVFDDVLDDVVEAVDPVFEAAQEGVTKARKTVSGRTATETMTPRSAVKAATTARQDAEQKATTARKAAAKKTSPAKRTTAKKAPAKKAATSTS